MANKSKSQIVRQQLNELLDSYGAEPDDSGTYVLNGTDDCND
ncbi:MAG: hypothetical protein M0Z55_08575 [Peptococcaceae bacterium]|nr:hypothetical protein [Peptococcaceae bacterium]